MTRPKIKVTIERLETLDLSYSGICINCGTERFGDTEPDVVTYNL